MKKILLLLSMFIITSLTSFAAVEDNQIIDQIDKTKAKELNIDFNLKTFKSCENLESVMWKYIKDYYKNHRDQIYPINYYRWWDFMALDSVATTTSDMVWAESPMIKTTAESSAWWSDDYSKTNTQVNWVDEDDIIKTDWKYIYYFNSKDKYVYVVKSYPTDSLEIIKKIKLPDNFYNPTLYLWTNRLIIISSWYSNYDYSRFNYWINRNSKTYSIIYDTTDIVNPKLLKLQISDWDLTKSRKIWKYLYIVSNNSFNIPYRTFTKEDDIVVNTNDILPKKLEISKTSDTSKQNLTIRWVNFPYEMISWNVAKCDEIEYVLPDEETLKKYDFNPSYNIINIVNTEDTTIPSKTKVIAWSNSEMYMSLDNLYLTSHMYQSYDFYCPIFARCFMPYYSMWENTLVHKLAINWEDLNYTKSNIIPWNPLNQYSMDEKDNYFRIITQKYSPERQTNLYILDKDLNLAWKLEWIGKTEDFKSSRFIWNKLFLVTFKQIDPLFAIDLTNQTKPEIIWELKIPGYSTYLHPYDDNHLIGIWYNTTTNQWWGTINDWLKIDLYEVNYDKKCGDTNLTTEEKIWCDKWDYKWVIVKQQHTLTLWQNWSNSEALNNPRMFMWNESKKLLLIPATLYANDWKDYYNYTDFYNWLFGISINKDTWIKEKYRISHIDTTWLESERNKDCERYTSVSKEPKCYKLIWWWEYCEPASSVYVPKYCYEWATIWSYLVSKSYDYANSFIKRWLWTWDNVYAISNNKISVSDLISWEWKKEIMLK